MDIKIIELLNKKDDTEVYKVSYNNKLSIFKIHFVKENFYRELNSLKVLSKNRLVPELITYKDNFETKGFAYLIEEKLVGDTLLNFKQRNNINEEMIWECGYKLGTLNTLLSKKELHDSNIWKYYPQVNKRITFSKYDWRDHFYYQIPVWIDTIDKKSINDINFQGLSEFLLKELKKQENDHLGFIHRDFGFRNILIENNKITGIIDYEHAMIGDIFFDTTKLIFNDLNFTQEGGLVRKFFEGWESATNVAIDKDKLWLYLTIQGIGGIQWVDKQKLEVNKKNLDYRNKSIDIVKLGLQYLNYKG
ncbi:TPA: aminoglycoside phosphotransferase family protein [Streptococcus pyogenes]|uniref:phosphotransferase family protein n=1 Tax=Streptococcus pyogenes TaxID=1314 RepID=UPI00109BE8E0|nr:aminoglycoside phosphotransferase family protein [Streptococcus pyogenes]QCK61512.1 aminoglycoside phosphotransferase family protein [Streptococcus pyogenes]VGQ64004.1 Hygromycin-B 4-O-kinase [Streptococcus pyogenes]VGQ66802.1 Hygromycin-B 4-O-kinase [Streptococcus pyogenes]VGT48810.1 Hygromycin-B 4-O-kinase [Streptococcus pyogenes]VGU74078.1 Hygromycin-B 4-O-kinase [Streptococcus pyogenes]